MTAKECLQMLREVKHAAFATVDEHGEPQVRFIDVMIVEGEQLIFCTARGKEFYRQLMVLKMAAVTVLTDNFEMVRLKGEVKKLSNQKHWIDRIFEENPMMNEVYPGESRYILEPFCIGSGHLEWFDLGCTPIHRRYYSFGVAKPEEKGFLITEQCTGCGRCAKICPQQCIQPGQRYRIMQEQCLHCGLCAESCPCSAVIRRGE